MGTWGYRPFENDMAMDWLADQVEQAMANAIDAALRAYLDNPKDEVVAEAEAAAALLVDCAINAKCGKYASFNIAYRAKPHQLWDLAIRAVDKMIADAWYRDFTSPAEKFATLNELRAELQQGKDRDNSGNG